VERQAALHRERPITASFVVSESLLIDRIGGAAAHTAQLLHLRRCADLPGFSLQALPLSRETHAGLGGPFVLLETPEHEGWGYTETQRGSHL